MSLLPYSWARPFLFSLDAEVAHEHTVALLAKTQNTPLQSLYAQARVEDPMTLAGLTFPNRIGLAAGLDKNAQCIDAFHAMGFGFVEVGTVTPKGQPGNPKPRMFRLPKAQALINRLGFNNEGLDVFLRNVQKTKFRQKIQTSPMLLGLNIGKNASTPIENAADDYLICLDGVYPYADYITVNISSPNTKNLRELQSDTALDALIGLLAEKRAELVARHHKQVPVFIKIAPDLDDGQITVIANTLKRHCVSDSTPSWGVIATNTTLTREAVSSLQHGNETGGLSGRPVLDKSNYVIGQLRQAMGANFPIIGVGGVMSAEDAVAKIQAGADLVQIYTGLIYKGPSLVRDAARAVKLLRS